MNSINTSPQQELDALLHSEAFSGVLDVTVEGQRLIGFAGGLANRARGRANTLGTRFATASVGKLVTAVCIARLVEAGVCQFEDLLGELVPSLQPEFGPDFSLAALLSHRSGLGDYLDDDAELPFASMDVSRLTSPQAFLPYVLQAPRLAESEFRYSSAGYILLGLAIESLTGQPYPAAIAQWVTEPAGMRSTGFPPMDGLAEDIAVGYLADGSPNIGHLPIVGGADGGLVTSVDDLQRFFRALRDGHLLGSATREFLWQSVSPMSSSHAYGHGFSISAIAGQTWFGHTGSDPGISARVAASVASDSSIIVLCNTESVAFSVFRLVLRCWEARAC